MGLLLVSGPELEADRNGWRRLGRLRPARRQKSGHCNDQVAIKLTATQVNERILALLDQVAAGEEGPAAELGLRDQDSNLEPTG